MVIDTHWARTDRFARPDVVTLCSNGLSAPVFEGVEQLRAELRRQLDLTDPADPADGDPKLLQVVVAPSPIEQTLRRTRPAFRISDPSR
ncbi:hypothetical protein [Mycobacterium kiyosense]